MGHSSTVSWLSIQRVELGTIAFLLIASIKRHKYSLFTKDEKTGEFHSMFHSTLSNIGVLNSSLYWQLGETKPHGS